MIKELRELLTLCLYALPAWAALRGLYLLMYRPRSRPRLLRELAMGLFAILMAGILCMALDGKWQALPEMLAVARERIRTGDRIHLTPFQTIGPQLRALPKESALTQSLGNTLLFAPWGFFLPLLWRRFRKPLRMAGMALALTCFIECTQLFIDRFVEVDDVLLNFLGSMLGAGVWWYMHRLWPQADRLFLAKEYPS